MKTNAWVLGPSAAEVKTFKSLENILLQLGQVVVPAHMVSKGSLPTNMDAVVLGTKELVRFYRATQPHFVFEHEIIDLPSTFGFENLLNDTVHKCKARDIPWNGEELFIKGSPISKGFVSFPSGVYSGNSLITEFDDLDVHVSSIKKIMSETRFFVLDGQIIGASKYALGLYMVGNMSVAPAVSAFAAEMVAKAPGTYVLDIAMVDEGPKVIEVNTFNSSGLFGIDLYAFATSVISYMEKNPPETHEFYATVTTHSSPIEAELLGIEVARSSEQAIKNLQMRKKMFGNNFLYQSNGKWYYAGAEIFTDKEEARAAYMRQRVVPNTNAVLCSGYHRV